MQNIAAANFVGLRIENLKTVNLYADFGIIYTDQADRLYKNH